MNNDHGDKIADRLVSTFLQARELLRAQRPHGLGGHGDGRFRSIDSHCC
jgi:hypothetical protein